LKTSLFTIIIVLFLDQLLKLWIKTSFELGDVFLDWGVLKFQFIENPGMAFGWSFGKLWGKIALSSFRLIAVVFIAFYIKRLIKQNAHAFYVFCISLIFAGALGNIIDSALYGIIFDSGTVWSDQYQGWVPYFGVSKATFDGYSGFLQGCVVDMIHLEFYWPSWAPFGLSGNEVFPPVFNVADFSISTGVCCIVVFYKKIVRDEDFKLFSS
jgi:signal peptidase II